MWVKQLSILLLFVQIIQAGQRSVKSKTHRDAEVV